MFRYLLILPLFFYLLHCKSVTRVSFVCNWPVPLMLKTGEWNTNLVMMVLKKTNKLVSLIYHSPWEIVLIELEVPAWLLCWERGWGGRAVGEPLTPGWGGWAALCWNHGADSSFWLCHTFFVWQPCAALPMLVPRIYRSACEEKFLYLMRGCVLLAYVEPSGVLKCPQGVLLMFLSWCGTSFPWTYGQMEINKFIENGHCFFQTVWLKSRIGCMSLNGVLTVTIFISLFSFFLCFASF